MYGYIYDVGMTLRRAIRLAMSALVLALPVLAYPLESHGAGPHPIPKELLFYEPEIVPPGRTIRGDDSQQSILKRHPLKRESLKRVSPKRPFFGRGAPPQIPESHRTEEPVPPPAPKQRRNAQYIVR